MEEKKVFNYRLVILVSLSLIAMQMLLSGTFNPDMHNSRSDIHTAESTFGLSKKKLINTKATNSIQEYYLSDHKIKSSHQKLETNPVVIIYLDGIPTRVQISKAPLKYNKDFAYSFTFDDGKENAYTGAYPLYSGGYSAVTTESYPGLHYTDGCGNNIPFKGGIAINSVGGNGEDTHKGTPGTLTWTQILDLYNKDWDVFNHSYSHKHGAGTDYNAEVIDNNAYIKENTGLELTHFVIPSGDGAYAPYAFNAGMKAVYNQNDCPGTTGLQIDGPVNLKDFKLCRQYLNEDNYHEFAGMIDNVAGKSTSGDHFWYNEFTHHVSPDLQGGSLLFSTFKQHMENLENKYGSKGLDNMWMAPLQEVYEYLSIRESTSITHSEQEAKVYTTISFDQVHKDLRRYAMTLLVNSDKNITQVDCSSASSISFSGTGENKIINIEWDKHPQEITTGLYEMNKSDGLLKAFPNPVQDKLTLTFPGSKVKKVFVSVMDEKGIEYALGESEVLDERITVDLKKLNLKKGIYIVRASAPNDKIQFSKLILKE